MFSLISAPKKLSACNLIEQSENQKMVKLCKPDPEKD